MKVDLKSIATLEQMNKMNRNTIMEVIGITYTEVGENYLCGSMPVDKRTHQPAGLLHGGASAVLAESLGSMGSALIADMSKNHVTGVEINANHIRGKREGTVFGKATIVHCGRTTHVWNIEITDEEGKLICLSRLTVVVIPKKENE